MAGIIYVAGFIHGRRAGGPGGSAGSLSMLPTVLPRLILGRVVFWCLVCHTLWWAAGEGLKVAVILERNSRLRCRVARVPSCRDPLGTDSVQEGPQHLPCDFPGGEGSGCAFQSNFTLAAAAEVLAFNPAVLGRSKIQGPVLSNHLQGTQSSLPNPGVGLACGFALQTP